MKTYQSHLPDALHGAFHRTLKECYGKLTLSEGIELGALLVLAEAGRVKSPEDAAALGASDRAQVVFQRALDGQPWTGAGSVG
jgi:hypothetical protein